MNVIIKSKVSPQSITITGVMNFYFSNGDYVIVTSKGTYSYSADAYTMFII